MWLSLSFKQRKCFIKNTIQRLLPAKAFSVNFNLCNPANLSRRMNACSQKNLASLSLCHVSKCLIKYFKPMYEFVYVKIIIYYLQEPIKYYAEWINPLISLVDPIVRSFQGCPPPPVYNHYYPTFSYFAQLGAAIEHLPGAGCFYKGSVSQDFFFLCF